MRLSEVDIKTIQENVFSLIGDQWMLVTAGDEKTCNTMTASWGGLGVLWNKNVATIYVRPTRYTKEFLDREDRFTLSFFDEEYKKSMGVCGSRSGRDCDKLELAGLHATYYEGVPYIEEARMVIVCKKIYHDTIKPENFLEDAIDNNYPLKDYHSIYYGEIQKVFA